MYKELGAVRSAALQREQTDKSYKKGLFSKYQNLVRFTDPLSKFALQEGNEDEIQSNVMSLVTEFLSYFSEMDKHFLSEGKFAKTGQRFYWIKDDVNYIHNFLVKTF